MVERLTAGFAAGMFAVVNPCGFAMLPAYLSFFLGLDDPTRDSRGAVVRGVKVALAVSAGFVIVFGLIGAVLQVFAVQYQEYLPYVTAVMGAGLVVLGVAMLAGYQPTFALPHLEKGGQSRELRSMVLFGVSYAIASLSCTLPIFLLQVANSFSTDGFAEGMATYVAFAAGMASLLVALTVSLSLARRGLVTTLRRFLPYVIRASGGLLVVAGAYLAYWGWYEIQILDGNLDAYSGPYDVVEGLRTTIVNWLDDVGPERIGLAVLVVVGALAGLLTWRSRRSPEGRDEAVGAAAPPTD